jgi:hypothetical protein
MMINWLPWSADAFARAAHYVLALRQLSIPVID